MRQRMRKTASLLLAVILVCALLVSCSGGAGSSAAAGSTAASAAAGDAASAAPAGEATPQYEKLKVGVLVGLSAMPVLYAEEQGWFKDAGLDIEVVVFPTGAPINEAMAADQLDIASIGMAGIFGLATGECTFLAEGNTAGGLGMFVREDSPILTVQGENEKYPEAYGNAELVKGMEVLLPLGTAAQYLLLDWAQGFGLTEADLVQVHMEYPAAYQAFSAGEGDALIVSPPYYFNCINDGYTEITEFDQNFYRDLVIARTVVAEERRDEVVLFLREFFRAADALSDDQLRYDYCMEAYKELGAEYTDETMNQEIELRRFITKDMMSASDFAFAPWLLPTAEFYITTEKVTEDQVPIIEDSIDLSLLEEALDFKYAGG